MKRFLAILFGDDDAIADSDPARRFRDEQVAAAALMVEAARLDGRVGPEEQAKILELLERRFGLPPAVARQLLERAERSATESVAWQGYTRAIKEALAPEERIGILEMLWEVAYADGELHDYEASLMRRVAGLLYVEDRESGEARLRVMERLGVPR